MPSPRPSPPTGEREKMLDRKKIDNLVKNHQADGFVKSFRCKARKNRGVKRTSRYAATTGLKRNAADELFTEPSG